MRSLVTLLLWIMFVATIIPAVILFAILALVVWLLRRW